MKEREPFVEEALDHLYEKAEKAGVAPVFTVEGRQWDDWDELEETFPEDMGIAPAALIDQKAFPEESK